MFYTLYKITNNINGKIYIGTHKTDNLDDGYFGSGKHLKNSINKYGIENFTKEIMQVFSSAEAMFDMEALLVNDEFVKRKDTYNIREGGFGGFDHCNFLERTKEWKERLSTSLSGENNPMYGKPGAFSGKTHTEETRIRISKGQYGDNNHNYGKHHTEETKQKIGQSNSKHQTGQGNSQYGKCWIYCPYTHESKPVPRYELKEWEDKGWVKGRKIMKH